jgi:hypothetical protein
MLETTRSLVRDHDLARAKRPFRKPCLAAPESKQFEKKAVRDASAGKLEEERQARLEKHRDLVDQINANLRKQRQK